eukprot:CAMPEP_0185835210 /NCGR_PEP_ID=MMETSP1353-20130828/7270_1 /TAXON_ID=1077150 /ORGANISM="Erythrolobus australicus, Strain CCMP3124" /LENGTH=81 /DNA_ID=CAMNT_0028533795 /DNA_START=1 /DNA_END=243 /DNA_ORIENTATION=-
MLERELKSAKQSESAANATAARPEDRFDAEISADLAALTLKQDNVRQGDIASGAGRAKDAGSSQDANDEKPEVAAAITKDK